LSYLIRNRIDKLKEFNNLSILNIDVFRNKKHEPVIILFLIHSFILIDLMRNEIKKIISYNDIKTSEKFDNQIIVNFKNIIFGVIFFINFF
jgi:hypothetical protein